MTLLEKLRESGIKMDYESYLKTFDLQAVVDGMIADAVKEIAAERDVLKAEVARLKEDKANLRANFEGEFWVWQGDGSDHLESLTCRVMIQPKQLDRLCKIEAAAKEHVDGVGKPFRYDSSTYYDLYYAVYQQPESPPKLVWEMHKDGDGNTRWWVGDRFVVEPMVMSDCLVYRAYGLERCGGSVLFPTAAEAKLACEKHAAEQAKGGKPTHS